MEPFIYSPIVLEGPTSRLLQLHGGTASTPIRCTLLDAWLDPDIVIPYEALSYTWGGTEKTDVIEVNGKFLPVTTNLFLALQHLRMKKEDRIMWIDAICINQDDPEERGHHVKQMAKVYKLAERVVIWLGPGTPGSDLLMECMQGLQRMSMDYACHDWKASDPRWHQMWAEVRPMNRDGENKAIESLLGREWFKRIWVLQEVAFARVAVVVCGSMSVSARIFSLVLTRTENVDTHCQAILDIMPGPSRRDSWWNENRDLSTLLVKFKQSCAGDVRDMIYALLGMSSDANDTDRLRPDYNTSMSDLVHRAVSFLLGFRTSDECPLPDWDLFRLLEVLPSLGPTLLHWAIWAKHSTTIKTLLEHTQVDMNARINYNLFPDRPIQFSLEYEKPMPWAVADLSDEILPLFLQNDSLDVTIRYNKDNTLLHLAAFHNRVNFLVSLLSRHDMDINSRNIQGETPLAVAGQHGCVDIITTLLNRKDVDFNTRDVNGHTPLSGAIVAVQASVVKLLLRSHEVAVNLSVRKNRTLLSLAGHRGNGQLVRLLLDRPDIDISRDKGMLWSLAAELGHVDIARRLLARDDIDVNARYDIIGREVPPLLVAAYQGHSDVMTLLLGREGIQVNARSENGDTALSFAASKGYVQVVGSLLLHPELEINTRDAQDKTPLFSAVENGHYEVVRLLLQHDDIDVNVKTPTGDTPLSLATARRDVDLCIMLLESNKATVNRTDFTDSILGRLLFEAARRGETHLFDSAISKSVDVNRRGLAGDSSLLMAAECGHAGTARLLLERGANPHFKSDAGNAALSLAQYAGHKHMAQVLVEHIRNAESHSGGGNDSYNEIDCPFRDGDRTEDEHATDRTVA